MGIETKIDDRLTWDEYFGNIALLAAERSSCLRRKVGAVAVKDKRVLATGYNGAPAGVESCLERGSCYRQELEVPSGERHELCRGLHAEQNLIIQAAKIGVSMYESSVYITTFPCIICTKMLINTGVSNIYYLSHYNDSMTESFLDEAGVNYEQLKVPEITLKS